MSVNDIEVIKLIIKMKELGITKEEFKEFKESLEVNKVDKQVEAVEVIPIISPFDNLSDDEILYWATPYGIELESKKEHMNQKHKETEELNGNN